MRRPRRATVARWIGWPLVLMGGAAALLLAVRLANPLPPLDGRTTSRALADPGATPMGRGVAAQVAANPGASGLYVLDDGREAFAARMLLARGATRTLDVQYYIWKGDLSGTLLLEELHKAADRGVRVRLLLDDNGVSGLDTELAALDRHPAIEVRLYNPFVVRRPKMIGYLTDFSRLNRRMHNKSFTADNAATIVGGRNVGDEYFRVGDTAPFADLDVMGVGPIVADTSGEFDLFWGSASAYPADRILSPVPAEEIDRLAAKATLVERDPAARDYTVAISRLPLIGAMEDGSIRFEWARTRMVCDPPEKTLGTAEQSETIGAVLAEAIGRPTRRLELVSAYFVPTDAGTDALAAMAGAGVRTAVLTNAYEATDVGIVHAGYAPYRERLLAAGIRLFELRSASTEAGGRRLFASGSGSGSGSGTGTAVRAAGATLHAKTFAVDGKRIFIGSFNFDPRSMHLNTEMGFVIDSPTLAGRLDDLFDRMVPRVAYEVVRGDDGGLRWIERRGDGSVFVHDSEPGMRWWDRMGIAILSRLPIEWML